MKILKELVLALDKRKLRPIETLNIEDEGDSVYRSFYHNIKDSVGEINEEDLALELCKTSASDKKYLMVKSRFKKRLINHLFFVDHSQNFTEDSKKITQAYKYVYLAKVLNLIGVRNASIYLINKSLPILEKYEILEVLITALQLKINEFSFKNKYKKLEEYSNQLLKNLKLLETESKVYILFQKAGFVFSKAEILKESDFNILYGYVTEISALSQNKDISFRGLWLSLSLQIEYLEYIGAYQEVVIKCKEALNLFNEKPHFNTKSRFVLVQTFLLEAFGKLQQIDNGEKIIEDLKTAFVETSFNWFHVQRKILFFYVNTKQFDKALEVAELVVHSKSFKNYNPRFKELWVLWHAFIMTMLLKENETLKIEKIMNSVISMSKDHLGVNTSRQVLEVFYKFIVGREVEIIDKVNVLAIHKSRHLKPNNLRRASLFYEFIIKSSKSGFDYKELHAIAIKTNQELNILKNSNPEKRAYEIIPYEDIIEMMLAKKKIN